MMNRLTIVGAGPGNADYILPKAKHIVDTAGYVFVDHRYLSLVSHERREAFGKISEMPGKVKEKLEECNVAVVVSGDPLFYSLTKLLTAYIPMEYIDIIPGISSTNYLAAKCRRTTENAAFLSSHGRETSMEEVLLALKSGRDVYMLCDGRHGPDWLARELCRRGLPEIPMAAGSRLSYEDEYIQEGKAEDFAELTFDSLCVAAAFGKDFAIKEPMQLKEPETPEEPGMLKESPLSNAPALLPDSAFIRDKVPMTREEVRWMILGKLGLFPGAVVWDLGAGTGSVSIECARLLANFGKGHVYSVERRADAAALISKNKEKFHLENMTVLLGDALEVLEQLPAPDCVFIGGSGKELPQLLARIGSLGPGITVVTACVTLETLSEALTAYRQPCFEPFEMTQVQISKGKTLGSYHMLEASHPVTLYRAVTRECCS